MSLFKIIFCTVLCFSIYATSNAAIVDGFGVVAGNSFSKFTNNHKPIEECAKKKDYFGSLYLNKKISNTFDLQIEVTFKKNGSQLLYELPIYAGVMNVEDNISLTNIEIPLLLKFPYFFKNRSKLMLCFGAFTGFNINGERSGSFTTTGTELISGQDFSGTIPNVNKNQYGLTTGFDYKLFSGKNELFISLRYNYYLSKIFNEYNNATTATNGQLPMIDNIKLDVLNLKHNQMSLGLGWNFGDL